MARIIPEMGETLSDLLERLGEVSPHRIPLHPPLGASTEQDVIAARLSPERWLYELVEGVLILKPPSFLHSALAGRITQAVMNYLDRHHLGVGLAASAFYRLKPGLVRIPNFSFISWSRLPGGELPKGELIGTTPDLVVELPRPEQKPREMDRAVREYLEAGVRRVWLIHYPEGFAEEFTADGGSRRLSEEEALDGGDVLPELTVPLAPLFASLDQRWKRHGHDR